MLMRIAVAACTLLCSLALAPLALAQSTPPAAPPAKPAPAPAPAQPSEQAPVYVVLATSKGDIALELYPDKAPVTVQNFLQYVDSGFYNGTQFHRIVPGFVIQGGGFDAALVQKAPRDPIVNESKNGLKNTRGSISMARTMDPNSATSQFFLNLKDNPPLDQGAGYAVFGQIVRGQEVMDTIAAIPTERKPARVLLPGGSSTEHLMPEVPVETVVITKATRATADEAKGAAPKTDAAPGAGGNGGGDSAPASPAPPAGSAPAGGTTPPAGKPR
jgi:peptidyl-prolyl cis-trans isomerase A (cyclophilin A)